VPFLERLQSTVTGLLSKGRLANIITDVGWAKARLTKAPTEASTNRPAKGEIDVSFSKCPLSGRLTETPTNPMWGCRVVSGFGGS